jgi:uncharacterized cupin superfamily protein
MSDPNIYEPEWETPAGWPLRGARVANAAGATELGVTVYEIPQGSAISPYHVHHGNEELLIVLTGTPTLRTPDGERVLEPGAVVAFPRGQDGAHKVSNAAGTPARVLLVSTMHYPEIAEHVSTGTLLMMTAPGKGKAFPAGADRPIEELYGLAMERDTSTS